MPGLADLNIYSADRYIRSAEAGQKARTLADLGQRAAQGDYAGAASAAFAGGQPDIGASLAQMDQRKKRAVVDDAASYAQAATTPEAWAQAGVEFKKLHPEFDWPQNFGARGALVNQALSAQEQIANAFRERQLGMQQEELGIKRQTAGMGAVPSGYQRGADGVLTFSPGGPADPATIRAQSGARAVNAKPTEQQIRNRQLYSVVKPEADSLLGDGKTPGTYDALGSMYEQGASRVPLIGNYLTSPDYQRAANSVTTVVANYLYSVSGATANPGEVANQVAVLMPRPGDSAATIAAKKTRLSQMVDSVRVASQTGGDAPSGDAGDTQLPPGVSEDDIQHTMQVHGLSREQVLQELGY
jgi:hypothetical protein